MTTVETGSTKAETAYHLLREEILTTRLAPDFPLRLNMLRERYGLGWTPLREALARLEAERLVVARSNSGFTVAPLARDDLADILRTRLLLELELLAEAIRRGDAAWEERIAAAHFRLSRCKLLSRTSLPVLNPSEENLSEWDQRHREFHEALLSAAQSDWLKRIYRDVNMHLRRHHRFLNSEPALQAATGTGEEAEEATILLMRAMAIDSHTDLMQAALDRDWPQARQLMTDHVGFTGKVFSQFGGRGEDRTAEAEQ